MDEYGKVYINLKELIKKKEISKTQLSYVRIDFNTIARLCYVLNCKISELIIYEPPKD